MRGENLPGQVDWTSAWLCGLVGRRTVQWWGRGLGACAANPARPGTHPSTFAERELEEGCRRERIAPEAGMYGHCGGHLRRSPPTATVCITVLRSSGAVAGLRRRACRQTSTVQKDRPASSPSEDGAFMWHTVRTHLHTGHSPLTQPRESVGIKTKRPLHGLLLRSKLPVRPPPPSSHLPPSVRCRLEACTSGAWKRRWQAWGVSPGAGGVQTSEEARRQKAKSR